MVFCNRERVMYVELSLFLWHTPDDATECVAVHSMKLQPYTAWSCNHQPTNCLPQLHRLCSSSLVHHLQLSEYCAIICCNYLGSGPKLHSGSVSQVFQTRGEVSVFSISPQLHFFHPRHFKPLCYPQFEASPVLKVHPINLKLISSNRFLLPDPMLEGVRVSDEAVAGLLPDCFSWGS